MQTETDYNEALDAFLQARVTERGTAGIVQAYRAVQSMPYRSVADRTPLTALRTGVGACTAKHLILRDLLRRMGEEAVIEIVEGDFASGIPVHDSMSPPLQAALREGGVIDMHCRVRLSGPDGSRHLDATWPLEMERLGFEVDRDWSGQGDTRQAIAKVVVRSEDDDVLGTKAKLLAGLSEEETRRRLEFLRLLTEWLATQEKR
ncbi:hypothetical protein LJR030_002431 [Rhizobium sp. LjRoot30]|uniref:hypothetical protein n=1 Tax=Rhizobium sp. LjRoot30 TaxID=3342320 RepID=UPI003ECF54AE